MALTRRLLTVALGLSARLAMAQQLIATTDPSSGGPEYDLDMKTAMSERIFNMDPLTDASSITVRKSPSPAK